MAAMLGPSFGELALASSRTSRVADALGIIDRALESADASDGRWSAAELLCVKGEIVLEAGAGDAAASAESLFRRSMDLARHRGSFLGAAGGHQPCRVLALTAAHEPSAQAAASGLSAVRRGLRHRRSRQG